jgi:hypothetical protein
MDTPGALKNFTTEGVILSSAFKTVTIKFDFLEMIIQVQPGTVFIQSTQTSAVIRVIARREGTLGSGPCADRKPGRCFITDKVTDG